MSAAPTSQPFNLANTQMPEQQQQHHQFGAQRMAVEVSNQQQQQQRLQQQGGESSVTLLIKHLPDAIPHETVFRLFSHYGATAVRPFSSGRMRNCAFVDFKNEALAYQAQIQLNGFLGKVLSVERASKPNEGNPNKQTEGQKGKENLQSASPSKDVGGTRDVGDGLKSGSVPVSEPIAPRLGVDYLFPPHLEYAYPPPDGNILTNIVNALIAVPRFYTQVLHLMNKMNIPAPFRMALPTPPLPPPTPAPPQPPPPSPPSVAAKHYLEDLSSSESEMESSDMEVDDKANSEVKTSGKKRKRNKATLGRGGIPAALVPKEIPVIKKKNPIFQVKIVSKLVHDEQKDDTLREETEDLNEWGPNHKAYATAEEIESKKLAPEEIFSKFKNYAAGIPAPVLYIKNLAKNVVVDDFFYIFGSLFGSIDAAKTGLGVKLMQEGRMRGQAFLTFPSVELANQALNLANGFVFKEKPMIIQFGRNPSAAKEN